MANDACVDIIFSEWPYRSLSIIFSVSPEILLDFRVARYAVSVSNCWTIDFCRGGDRCPQVKLVPILTCPHSTSKRCSPQNPRKPHTTFPHLTNHCGHVYVGSKSLTCEEEKPGMDVLTCEKEKPGMNVLTCEKEKPGMNVLTWEKGKPGMNLLTCEKEKPCILLYMWYFPGRALVDLLVREGESPPVPNKRVLCRHPFMVSVNFWILLNFSLVLVSLE